MEDLLKSSKDIIDRAVLEYKPYAVVAAVSGGDDSMAALALMDVLGLRVDYIMHGVTGTGVSSTTEHVRKSAANLGIKYLEASAGDEYERYVLRKGFFGIGIKAHTMAYHILKERWFIKAIARNIRFRRRNRNILIITGARNDESANRRKNLLGKGPIKSNKPIMSNIWVSPLFDWSKKECITFLAEQKVERCRASMLCHRSGECMCGTMQSKDQADELAYWFPDWGEWWRSIRARVADSGYSWDWGEDYPRHLKLAKKEEKATADGQLSQASFEWLPLCNSCISEQGE